MAIFVAPTEPLALRQLGTVNMIPEKWGCDVVVWARRDDGTTAKVGVQRKEIGDLIASLGDDRLVRELGQMSSGGFTATVLVIEGRFEWSNSGDGDAVLMGRWSTARPVKRSMIHGLMLSMNARGVWVMRTDDVSSTVGFVKDLERWVGKVDHGSLTKRGGAGGAWGTTMSWEWCEYMLQGFPGVGVKTAKAIYEKFGLPLKWTVGVDELASVYGVSKKGAQKLIDALESDGVSVMNRARGKK